ncbi:cyclic AMP-dependent transcription factor ATF-6 beta isoform X2 [Choloepus didactylus]|uniref:cyclic AMP-dependent transcription factor ATF-6 beta isoform X2 n=1 Tax=Choloepus didactylus TaxID=27675 RepID=UPI00189C7815|nr:cyclic AMP-dependent transcription factor ATF-6 beta isoform X2 [Choloepus didactylus]
MVGGWGGKMAELMLLSEIADSTRFFTDNLLSPEDWDSTLYTGLDEVAEEQTQLFRCPEQDVLFDSSSLDVGMDVSPPEPPWDALRIFPDLQVKSEPSSPCSSSSLSSDSSHLSSEPSSQAPVVGEVLDVKTESLAPPLCLLGDGPTSPLGTIQINVGPTSDDPSGVQTKIEPVSPSSSINSEASLLSAESPSQALIGEEILEVKTESPSPPGCLLQDVLASPFGTVQISMGPYPDGSSGKTLPAWKPPLQPKPVVITTVPLPPRAVPSNTTVLLQPLVQPTLVAPVSPVVLIQGAVPVQPEGPVPPAPRPEKKSIVLAPMPGNSCPPEVDAKLLKRQQRMIKNRESACQSRRKKKEYLQGLEARLQAVLADNQQLRRENAALRRRLEALLAENNELKLGSGNRKVVCIMVFLLFIAFNFGPVSISEPPVSPQMSGEEPRPRRHLLEFSEQEPVRGVEPLQGSTQEPEEPQPSPTGWPSFRNLTAFPGGAKELLLRDLDQLFLSSDCRHFNRTESLRLADELSGWVQRHQRGRRKIPQRVQERQSQLWKKSPPVKAVPTRPPRPPKRDSVSQLQLYHHPDRSQPEFLDAIDRREDTFYVVSFRRDHLLLPAISHNKTSRPKMSLVMPAMAPNETLSGRGGPGDYEEMMQIECEVMDTRVIHIKTSTVPPSLRKQPSPTPGNATGGPLPAPTASQAHQASHQPLYLNHP